MRRAISSPDGPGDVAVEDGDVVGVDAQQLQGGVAVAGDVGRDRLQAQPVADGLGQVGLVLDDQHAHALDATSRRISSAYRKPHTRRQHRAALTGGMTRTRQSRGPGPPVRCSSPSACRPPRRRSHRLSSAVAPGVGAAVGAVVAPAPSRQPRRPVRGADAVERRRSARPTAVPDGVTVFDDDIPAWPTSTRLSRGAPRGGDGCRRRRGRVRRQQRLAVPGYQEQLLDEAVATYGSRPRPPAGSPPRTRRPTSRATPSTSAPVTAAWLSEHGAGFGLCQIYRNEPWHFELRPDAVDRGCPAMYADPSHDPRMNG